MSIKYAVGRRAESVPITWNRGILVIDPRYDTLPLGPGWEWWV